MTNYIPYYTSIENGGKPMRDNINQFSSDYYMKKVAEINRYRQDLFNSMNESGMKETSSMQLNENQKLYRKLTAETTNYFKQVLELLRQKQPPMDIIRFLESIKLNYQKLTQIKGVKINYELFIAFVNQAFTELREDSHGNHEIYNILMDLIHLIEYVGGKRVRKLDELILDLIYKEGKNLKYDHCSYCLISSVYKNELLTYVNHHLINTIKYYDILERGHAINTKKFINQLKIKRTRQIENVCLNEEDTYERLSRLFILIGSIFPVFFYDEFIQFIKEVFYG